MTEWNKVKLGEICSITSSKRIFAKEYQTEGIPFYRGKEIIEKHNGNDVSTELFISRERYEEIKNKFDVPHRGDILLSSVGTLGVSWLVDEEEFYFKDGNLTWLRCNQQTTPEFLYLWLNSPEAQNQIDAMCIGSTQKALTIETLNKFNVTLPTLDIQNKICEIITPISKKITVNRATNRNLQDQAFALFEQLVMEHDPEDVCNLSEISDINPKRILSKNVEARCIDMAKLSTSGAFPDGWEYKLFTSGMKFQNGDTLLARITPCLENGKTAYINFLNDKEVAFGSTEYVVLAAKGNTPPEMLYCLARYSKFVDYAVKNMNGSSGRQRISGETVGQYQVPNFNNDEMDRFRKASESNFEMMKQNSFENMRLIELRDALLPRLMSGEIDVSNL